MQYLIEFSESLKALTAFMTFFLGIHLISFKPQSSIRWMGVFLLALSLKCSSSLLVAHQALSPLYMFFDMSLLLPIFYYFLLSIVALSGSQKTPSKKAMWLLPWLLASLHNIYWLTQAFDAKLSYLKTTIFRGYHFTFALLTFIFTVSLILWWFKHPQVLYRRLPKQESTWIKVLFGLLMVLSIELFFKACLALLHFDNHQVLLIDGLATSVGFVVVCGLGLAIFQKTVFFHEISLSSKQTPTQDKPQPSSAVLPPKQQEIYIKLEQLINNPEIYTNPDLSLEYLAKRLETKKQVLTKVIYHHTGGHYYDYINQLRVQKFKEMLTSKARQKLSIEGMAIELGFKSKATLYKYFKKNEGTTPAKYHKKISALPSSKKWEG